MATYRKPTEKESEKLNMSRKKMIEGIMGEKDIFSKMMPTMAKSARDDIRAAKAMRESVPASAREGEAYQDAGYKKGGKVKKPTMTYQSYSDTGEPAGMKTITVKKASGGKVTSASKRADGCAIRGKTKA
jgi:hypothetical protein